MQTIIRLTQQVSAMETRLTQQGVAMKKLMDDQEVRTNEKVVALQTSIEDLKNQTFEA
jgi:predicted  nucleic acid-binding Zn-ribbon protein